MQTVIVVGECMAIETEEFYFHYRGVYRGFYLEGVKAKRERKWSTIKIRGVYVLYLTKLRVADNFLHGTIVRVKEI